VAASDLLVWLALIGYAEAAVAYAGELRGPGVGGRLGTWGVRLGWIVHTLLLIAQAVGSEGFAWSTWAGALNLLVWLIVAVYLVWGCRPRFRLLGLLVMPLAAALLLLAWAGDGTGVVEHPESDVLLVLHAAFMLAAFAGLTVAAGMAALYLWEDRKLKRRDAAVLRLRLPSLESLDRLASRVSLASVGLLTAGIGVGLASFGDGDFDAAMAVSLVIWAVYATALILRREAGLCGRRLAWLVVSGFALVAIVLPVTHFAA
jgi:ABC-type uncharacterized transport system permease subunit